ncbi:hypothetical protein [Streptomyces sp. bgisy100]|uniref:hypothetical protein n=1 Tax=Streptomyces sp. bgisy100 TaxID=3413783 RepID=UPI003D739E26
MACAHWRRLPLGLAREARERSASGWVDSAVQCQLSAHVGGEHFGFLDDVEHGTALWLRWRGTTEVALVVLSDCPVAGPGPDKEGCCLFADHSEQHTWQDTVEEIPCTS